MRGETVFSGSTARTQIHNGESVTTRDFTLSGESPGLDLFPVFIINLSKRPERRTRMERVMHENRVIEHSFFEAIYRPSDFIQSSGVPTAGHLGCLRSHRALLKQAERDNYPGVTIFEDDVAFRPGFDIERDYHAVTKRAGISQSDIDVTYFGTVSPIERQTVTLLSELDETMGAYAVSIPRSSFKGLLKITERETMCIDRAISLSARRKLVFPDTVLTSVDTSDTGKKSEAFYRKFSLGNSMAPFSSESCIAIA